MNRATLLTPPGAAAIAVVRIAGPAVNEFLAGHFSRAAKPLRCVHGNLTDDDGAVIDDPVVVLAEGGAAADLNLHGGPWVVASTLELLRRHGFEVVEHGPGTPLQIESAEGDTLLEREVASHLPLAKTDEGVRMLLAQPANWRAFVGSNPTPAEIGKVLDDGCLAKMLHPPRVAIVGAPNVGKSTLANQLFAQQRSITADVPGTTRDWVGEIANIDGLPVMLVDTPGVRETSDPIEHQAIERSRAVVTGADLIVYVIDATAPFAPATARAVLRVLNKSDRGPPPPGLEFDVSTVATTGQGVDELRRLVRHRLGCDALDPARPRVWTQRQRDLLQDGRLTRVLD